MRSWFPRISPLRFPGQRSDPPTLSGLITMTKLSAFHDTFHKSVPDLLQDTFRAGR